jgi:hypothetical protein
MPDTTIWLLAVTTLLAAATIVYHGILRPLAPKRITRQPTRPVLDRSPNRHAWPDS